MRPVPACNAQIDIERVRHSQGEHARYAGFWAGVTATTLSKVSQSRTILRVAKIQFMPSRHFGGGVISSSPMLASRPLPNFASESSLGQSEAAVVLRKGELG